MKPAHILTEHPELYAAAIAAADRRGMVATAGPEPPAGVKYVFEQARPETDLARLAGELRKADVPLLTLAGVSVRNALHVAPRPPDQAPELPAPEPCELPVPMCQGRSARTALLLAAYGDCPLRQAATARACQQLRRLDPMPEVYFCELTAPGQSELRYIPEWVPEDNRLVLERTPANEGAWQKESACHLLADLAMSRGAENLVCLDPDSYPDQSDWIARIEQQLRAAPDTLLQPWQSYSDTVAETHRYVRSYVAARNMGVDRVTRAPGLAWAMTSGMWQTTGGFNRFVVPGGGDCEWVLRIDPGGPMTRLPFSWPWWVEIHTMLPEIQCALDCCDIAMVHVHHGAFDARAYQQRNLALKLLGVPVLANLYLDDRGLLAIRKTPEGDAIRYLMHNKSRMVDDTAMHEVVAESRQLLKGK